MKRISQNTADSPHVVIIGAGFGGLQAARKLRKLPVRITLIDRNNHHTFQPLLYQVAASILSPAQIATSLRMMFRSDRNVDVILGEVTKIDVNQKHVVASGIEFSYDYLIVAAGARHSYFGRDEWEEHAPGLKTIDDALQLRQRILLVLEQAERESIGGRRALADATASDDSRLNFVVVGGGPTGVELAGMLATLTHQVVAEDFRGIDTTHVRVLLLDAGDRVLRTFDEKVSRSAEEQLRSLGVEVRTCSKVKEVGEGFVRIGNELIPSAITIWATGVAASPLAKFLSADLDGSGRVPVGRDLTLRGHRNVFVIGDLASAKSKDGGTLPGLASVAQQQGSEVAEYINNDLCGKERKPFRYRDKGLMATIGRQAAVAQYRGCHLSRTPAWMLWAFVHATLLVDLRTRTSVIREWIWSYITRKTSAALITGSTAKAPLVAAASQKQM